MSRQLTLSAPARRTLSKKGLVLVWADHLPHATKESLYNLFDPLTLAFQHPISKNKWLVQILAKNIQNERRCEPKLVLSLSSTSQNSSASRSGTLVIKLVIKLFSLLVSIFTSHASVYHQRLQLSHQVLH
jgi:hypothetical protein